MFDNLHTNGRVPLNSPRRRKATSKSLTLPAFLRGLDWMTNDPVRGSQIGPKADKAEPDSDSRTLLQHQKIHPWYS